MDRVTTQGLYNGVLNNLMASQSQLVQDTAETSSGMIATDLKGFGATAETITAMQNVQAQTTAYLTESQNTASKLSIQDMGLTQLGEAATSASKAVTDAIGAGSGATLMQSLQGAFQDAAGALNMQYNGQYVFAGGQVKTQPVPSSSLTALGVTPAPAISSLFNNDQQVTTTQLTSSTTVQTGFLASSLGTPLFTAMQSIAAYDQSPNGPFADPLTPAQATFLQGAIASLNAAGVGVNAATSQNGLVQKQVTNAQASLTTQQTSLQTLIGDKTSANLAEVAANLSQAQLAVQVAAQVFQTLKTSSLASLLPIA